MPKDYRIRNPWRAFSEILAAHSEILSARVARSGIEKKLVAPPRSFPLIGDRFKHQRRFHMPVVRIILRIIRIIIMLIALLFSSDAE